MFPWFDPSVFSLNLFASAVWTIAVAVGTFLFTRGYQYYRVLWRNRTVMRLLRIGKRKVCIIHAAKPREIDSPGFYYYPSCDMRVVWVLESLLRRMRMNQGEDYFVYNQIEAEPLFHEGHLDFTNFDYIFVGGTKANTTLARYIGDINARNNLRYHLGFDVENHRTTIRDSTNHGFYQSTRDQPEHENESEQHDFALIQSIPNALGNGSNFAVFAGTHGIGTLGLASILTDEKKLRSIVKSPLNEPIEELVLVEFLKANPERVMAAKMRTHSFER